MVVGSDPSWTRVSKSIKLIVGLFQKRFVNSGG